MKRPAVNFLVDAASFVAFLLLMSTGLLLRYQLPPGSGSLEPHGPGQGAGRRLIDLVWGWTRHDWGDLHYWIALALVAILAVHLVLHWKWIVCMVRGTPSEASGWKFGLGLASLVALVLLAAAPLLAPKVQKTRQQLMADDYSPQLDASDLDQLRGSMTLEEAAAEGGVSVKFLRERLGLAEDVSPEDRIGPSLRKVDKHMSDLRRLLQESAESDAPNEQEEFRP